MVCAEHLTSASLIDKQAEVATYLLAMERLTVMSAQPHESAKIIESILAEGDPR
jgi:hypothetical protein